ncbi:MAG TPA: DNA-formamidopyrimidine glycosylase family protein [Anaerolineaceae bacterium]|nr:DNA-formamidopyrimidine glycosylase family protein [Anaerolineaceae bacterium]
MPELPEIATRAHQMNAELSGKRITHIEVFQSKCLNISPTEFIERLVGAKIGQVTYHGKWLFVSTSQGWLLLNLGMGGEVLLVNRTSLPEKYRLIFDFDDGSCMTVNFWWFGYAHYVPTDQLPSHAMTAKLGANALDLDGAALKKLFKGQHTRLKALMLDQSKIAGIGNAYIHDILFLARLHPLRTIDSLKEDEIEKLAKGIQDGLRPSLEKGGAFYEVDLFGHKGGFTMDDILIGYKENRPCPVCLTSIQKIKTGSTSSFICPSCQRFESVV